MVLSENCIQDKSTGIVSCMHCSDFKLNDSTILTKNLLLEVLSHVAEVHYEVPETVNNSESSIGTQPSPSIGYSEQEGQHSIRQITDCQNERTGDAVGLEEHEKGINCPMCNECVTTKAVNSKNRDLKRILYCHYFKSHISTCVKPVFNVLHQKLGYLCDKCDFFSEVIYFHTSTTSHYDSQRAWCARRVLVQHHMELHLDLADNVIDSEINELCMSDAVFAQQHMDNESGQWLYGYNAHEDEVPYDDNEDSGSEGSILVSLLEPEVILSYSSPDESDVGESSENESKPMEKEETVIVCETEDQFKCPKCVFIASKRHVDRQSAQNKLLIHYKKEHLPARSNERLKTEDGGDYYECIFCDFKATVQYSASTIGVAGPQCRYETRLKLAWHYISQHDTKKKTIQPLVAAPLLDLHELLSRDAFQKSETEHKDQGLPSVSCSSAEFKSGFPNKSPSNENEGTDEVFKCPKCDFLSPSDVCVAESIKIRVYRARQKVYSHYALSHLEDVMLSTTEKGLEGYLCDSCSYFAKLGTYKSGYHAKYFAKGALAKHILEEHDNKSIDPVEVVPTETEILGMIPKAESEELSDPHSDKKSEVEVIEIDSSSDEEKAEVPTSDGDLVMDYDDDCGVPVIDKVFSQSQMQM